MKSLSNISVAEYRAALAKLGLTKRRTKGDHEAWMKAGMTRPVIFQSGVSPVPEFIVRNGLRDTGISRAEFLSLFE